MAGCVSQPRNDQKHKKILPSRAERCVLVGPKVLIPSLASKTGSRFSKKKKRFQGNLFVPVFFFRCWVLAFNSAGLLLLRNRACDGSGISHGGFAMARLARSDQFFSRQFFGTLENLFRHSYPSTIPGGRGPGRGGG